MTVINLTVELSLFVFHHLVQAFPVVVVVGARHRITYISPSFLVHVTTQWMIATGICISQSSENRAIMLVCKFQIAFPLIRLQFVLAWLLHEFSSCGVFWSLVEHWYAAIVFVVHGQENTGLLIQAKIPNFDSIYYRCCGSLGFIRFKFWFLIEAIIRWI